MIQLFRNLYTHRHALRSQFMVNIKTTITTTRLGVLWWILDPLALMAIYTFVVKIVFERGGPGYHIFVLCGLVCWQAFSRSVTIGAKSLTGNASLIRQTPLPLHLYVLIPPVVQSFFFLIGLSIIAVWNHEALGWHTLAAPLLIAPLILLTFGLGLFLSILEVYLPDTGKLLPYAMRLGLYMSPVLYSPERIYALEKLPDFAKTLYALNPMLHVITAARDALFIGQMFNLRSYALVLLASLVLVQAGLSFFHRFEAKAPKYL
ncbi:ABC transporter permease [Desulfonatronum sp. SC1]|uniref:ABC transporter permease n=1 Tax=Desulfonatronum sp. SC1 TaxID=2109626 RepID=UPI000D2F78B8|nr:ABC transporter permease [Desulfonatronum sp. SC1]PTN33798.1 hypothetical protein C6366_14010 [Desulfonatronum sp. SC1]